MANTPNLGLPLPAAGSGAGVWAAFGINGIVSLIDEALDGVAHVTGSRVQSIAGASDDARRRVWLFTGEARTIDVPAFSGVRVAIATGPGIILRPVMGIPIALGIGAFLIHSDRGEIRLADDRPQIDVYTPTESPLRHGSVALMTAMSSIALPLPLRGSTITVVAGNREVLVRGPIDTAIAWHDLHVGNEALVDAADRTIETLAYVGQEPSINVPASRSMRFVGDGERWIAC